MSVYLGFDYGLKRIGVASGNALTQTASPLLVVKQTADTTQHLQTISRLVREWQPCALVVGVPFHPDGAPHKMTAHARRFAQGLREQFHLNVHEVDERYSSVEAARLHSDAKRLDQLDATAAVVILEQYLQGL